MTGLSISFLEHFKDLNDPRTNNHKKRHSLTDILLLTIFKKMEMETSINRSHQSSLGRSLS